MLCTTRSIAMTYVAKMQGGIKEKLGESSELSMYDFISETASDSCSWHSLSSPVHANSSCTAAGLMVVGGGAWSEGPLRWEGLVEALQRHRGLAAARS